MDINKKVALITIVVLVCSVTASVGQIWLRTKNVENEVQRRLKELSVETGDVQTELSA